MTFLSPPHDVPSDRTAWGSKRCKSSHSAHSSLQLLTSHPPLAKTDQDQRVPSSNRSMVWSFLSWLFQLGHQKISEDQNNLLLKIAANLEGEGKASVEVFDKILGSTTYAEPKITTDAIKMLVAVPITEEKLAGDKPCIALAGYTYAAELMGQLDQPIILLRRI